MGQTVFQYKKFRPPAAIVSFGASVSFGDNSFGDKTSSLAKNILNVVPSL